MFNLTKKINARNSILALGVTAFGLLIAPNSAQAMNLVNTTNFTDTDFIAAIDNGEFSEKFVVEGRIGDSTQGTAQYKELKINGDIVDKSPVAEETQFNWVSGKEYDFSVEYDGSTLNYVFGGQTLTTQKFNGSTDSVFFRTSAWKNSTTALTNLVFNGDAIGNLISNGGTNSPDVDYLQLDNASSPFMITGKASMTWDTIKPKGSQSAFQIKVGNSSTTSVPEPGTIGAIFITGLCGLRLSKKKKKQEA